MPRYYLISFTLRKSLRSHTSSTAVVLVAKNLNPSLNTYPDIIARTYVKFLYPFNSTLNPEEEKLVDVLMLRHLKR